MSASAIPRDVTSRSVIELSQAAPPRRHLTSVPAQKGTGELIPGPSERLVRSLATHAFEAVEGLRSIAQLGSMISVGAARQLALQRTALRERRQVYGDTRNCAPSPGPAHLCRVLPHLVEASVVLYTEHRAYAVALRLEWLRGRWRACELYVL